MARLIKTEREVEGRYETIWLVVEEDALDQWPGGPLSVVGQPAPRKSGPARARGEARYIGDLRPAGLLQAAVLRSPYAHARVRRIDLSRALSAPGVRGALGPGEAAQLDELAGYHGAPVAAVAADSLAEAQAALELIDVEWEVLEPLLDPDEAVRRGQLLQEPRTHERGDVDQALADADVVIEAEYRTQSVVHNALETHQAVCVWEGPQLTVYISTQDIWGVRNEVARTLGMERDDVRVVCEYMGGGFGAKNNAHHYTYVAAELARRTGRPVRCALTRREEATASGNRNPTIQRLKIGARFDGTITALQGDYIACIGWSGWHASTAGPMQTLYACPNVRTVEYPTRLNTPPMESFRAPGFVEGTFGMECLVDELAARLGIDPLELRRRNHTDSDPAAGRVYSSKNLLECYRRAETHWARRETVKASSKGPWKRGVGMASQIWGGGGGPPAYAWLRIGSDGRAQVVTGMQDIGTGSRTVMAQIAAEELGLPLDRVDTSLGDTSRGPFAVAAAGSSTTPSMGPAVRAAAADAARQILEIAAQRYERTPEALRLAGGRIVATDGESWPLSDLLSLLGNAQILGKGARGPNPAGMGVHTFGVQVVEVAVDVETGQVVVDKVYSIHDVGRVINPLGASSQIEGGIIQGVGGTLSERQVLDAATGTVLTRTLDAYRMPTIADVPEIVAELVDVPDPNLTNLGAKGLGEPPIIPVAAAIANAIRDATGADVRELPIDRATMLAALRKVNEDAAAKERHGTAAAV
ncbi:xanthine dehydrogenase family protein molybdopterin-binding subunit [Tenggerimyces flavus]|uniref:Xanthine dehydrogenase family protein molybdopterin-binding subunit n=1 Tax=Tenggerimyces flavus TaxID=1708749 RepID=A0ABV7YCW8_9ACTN|nr:xanthine dehydrogenase family protein molybdopterin-binding subunit [Tenggerimyces flavus]MBM7789046.1 xanthine dehydrogenase YagR molybdenum-binding subunit [Tenggerimyces flavus]